MERVLIVDDDPDIQRLVSYNFSTAGFEVSAAASGRTALESIRKQPPDLMKRVDLNSSPTQFGGSGNASCRPLPNNPGSSDCH